MKYFFYSIIVCAFSTTIFSQNNPDLASKYKAIVTHLEKKEYIEAIQGIDAFLEKYPYNAGMYFNRGLAEYNLNDYTRANYDLIKAKSLGLNNRDRFINFITSKPYVVDHLVENYLTENNLDYSNGFKPKFSLKDSIRGALRAERTCYDVYFYDLTVKIHPWKKSIEGSNIIYFITTNNTQKIQIDLTQRLKIKSITYNGTELKYERLFDGVFISFENKLLKNTKHEITINYFGRPIIAPSPPWNGGMVWKWNHFNRWISVCCEHLGSSSWWPSKDHLSDKPDSMRINIQVPNGYEAVSNGNLRSKNIINNYTHFEWFVSYPINSYNVTFYMGKFVNFNELFTNENGSYQMDYYVLKQHLEVAKKYYSQTKDIVTIYEKLFGEYPYKKDGIGMVEAPYAGMEHQGAIAIGNGYGKEKRRVYKESDYDYLLVHETAHEWWGNAVTMSDMADAWISEAFATYAEHLFIEQKYGYASYIDAQAKTWFSIYNIWPLVGIRDVNDITFIGGDIYHKGAAMIGNFRCILNNDSIFFSLIKCFFNDNKFKTLTSQDVINYINQYTGNDYSDFFNAYLFHADPPVLKYHFTLEDERLSFTYQWINVGENFSMPFNVSINDTLNYRLEASTTAQIYIKEGVKSFYLPNEKRYKKEQISKNSFTYYWTNWEK